MNSVKEAIYLFLHLDTFSIYSRYSDELNSRSISLGSLLRLSTCLGVLHHFAGPEYVFKFFLGVTAFFFMVSVLNYCVSL
jgi:hypothetical protein